MPKVTVTKAYLDRGELEAMPSEDRALLVTMGLILNELGFLFRIWLSARSRGTDNPLGGMTIYHELQLMKYLAGKFFEAGNRLGEYQEFVELVEAEPELHEKWIQFEDLLKPKAPYVYVRNNHSFHVPGKRLTQQSLDQIAEEEFYMLVGDARQNFFAQYSEVIMLKNIRDELSSKFGIEDIGTFAFDTFMSCGNLVALLSEVSNRLMLKNFSELKSEEIELMDVPQYPNEGLHPFISFEGKV